MRRRVSQDAGELWADIIDGIRRLVGLLLHRCATGSSFLGAREAQARPRRAQRPVDDLAEFELVGHATSELHHFRACEFHAPAPGALTVSPFDRAPRPPLGAE